MRKSFILLIALAAALIHISPIQGDASQPQRPGEDQIRAYLNTHPLMGGGEVLAVTLQGEALVIDLPESVLESGTYDQAVFTTLQNDLDRAYQVDLFYMTTFLVAGKPLEFWGRPLPDFDGLIPAQPPLQVHPVKGPLTGMRIALNPGHGLYWNEAYSMWTYQRLEFWGIREDTLNLEIMRYLQVVLLNQGALVIQLREFDDGAPLGVSTFPAWHEATRHYAIAHGLPAWIYDGGSTNLNSDIRARPYLANYYEADILINLHNNGWNGTFTGTETYWDVNNHPQSLALANAVHGSIIQTIRDEYDPGWTDRGVKRTNWSYAENYYAQMPAVLVELAFMDHPHDNLYLHDEAFKLLAAKAIAAGICDFAGVTCRDIWTTPLEPEFPVFLPLVLR